MKKNFMLIVALAAVLFLAAPMTSKAADSEGAWIQGSQGYYYELADGSYYANGFYDIEGKTYYFDEEGWMQTGWQYVDWSWYYCQPSGEVAKGWAVVDSIQYYFNEWNGWMYSSGASWIDGKCYLFAKDGAWMSTPGWNSIKWMDEKDGVEYDTWYYIVGDGTAAEGWLQVDGTWYFFGPNMYDGGIYTIDDKDWLFDDNGMLMSYSGWNWADGWVYVILAADGSVASAAEGWSFIEGNWYYFNEYSNKMVAGSSYSIWNEQTQTYDRYFFDYNGAMVTGWYNYGDVQDKTDDWVYCNANGVAFDGWLNYGGSYYYFENGYMCTEQSVSSEGADGEYDHYYVGKDGKMVYGWYHRVSQSDTGYYSDQWIYTDPATGEMYTGWVQSAGKWYGIVDGYMQRGCATPVVEYPDRDDFATPAEYQAAVDKYYNSFYVFKADGTLASGGWYAYNSTNYTTWMYANADGSAYNGWLQDGGNWYYINHGYMATNQYVDGGYWVGADGICK